MTFRRRTVLSGLAATALSACTVRPKFPGADYDCVIVGAGAAGIAAGRYLGARGKRVILLEARERSGGRAWTDSDTWGIPFDHGAAWLHHFDRNPLRKLLNLELDVRSTSTENAALYTHGQRLGDDEHVAYAKAEGRIFKRMRQISRSGEDVSLGSLATGEAWERRVIDLACSGTIGAPPSDVSVRDLSGRPQENDVVPLSGVGTLVVGLGSILPTRFGVPVEAIDTDGLAIKVVTGAGTLEARSCIVTVPVSVLASGRLRFSRKFSTRISEDFGKLGMGVFEKVAFRLQRRPQMDEDYRVAFLELEAGRPHVLSLHPSLPVVSVLYGADWARNIRADGREEQIAFGRSVLEDVFGSGIRADVVGAPIVTDWLNDQWALGSYAYVRSQHSLARQVYGAELDERLSFAGEAAPTEAPATVGGA